LTVDPDEMCPTTAGTLYAYKRRDPKFHCIVAGKNKTFRMFRVGKRNREWLERDFEDKLW
jgi:hypothetical protein